MDSDNNAKNQVRQPIDVLKIIKSISLLVLIPGMVNAQPAYEERLKIALQMEHSIKKEMLNCWYPRCRDTIYGGFLSSFTSDWRAADNQDKMIVTQARHTWSNAKASLLYPENPEYRIGAKHGFDFLQNVMWDKEYRGFFTLVNRYGQVKKDGSAKTAYGNAFGLFALAAYYGASSDPRSLNLAKETFRWLEEHSHDPVHKGYFQHLKQDGTPVVRPEHTLSTTDIGYKDQNSSIHLLEAFTELFQAWPDALVKKRLAEMLFLIRDTMVGSKGYLTLFFQPDWTPITYRDSSMEVIRKHFQLDHVSFGHDIETAFLMMEASQVLGLENDSITLVIAKKMLDHSLENGWDDINGGFYDEGYYFKGDDRLTIIKDSKNWWAQAEGLNTLLIMADLYPSDKHAYFEKFKKQWEYIKVYIIDHQYGDWYAGGLDKEPQQKSALKGHIWKGNYHQFRSLSNCVNRLRQNK